MIAHSINGRTENIHAFSGKIAVITDAASANKDDFHSADHLLVKYGAKKIIRATWPENFISEKEQMIKTVTTLAADPEIKALILNQAVDGSNATVDKLRETRDDLFIVYCNTNEDPSASAFRANLHLMLNDIGMGEAIVKQARKQGAKAFVHYSFERHMSKKKLSNRRDMIQKTCASEGLKFIDVTGLDPTGETGLAAAQQFIRESVPKLVAEYGEDTAFFCTNCHLQISLIMAVVDCHAIYPQPCCPSPYHGFPEALGIETEDAYNDLNRIISEACRIAEEKNMTDRLSTWPVSSTMMFSNAGAEYAIKWIKGEVPRTSIDNRALLECMNNYITEVVGEESNVYMTSYSENGITYNNIKLVLMGYLDF